MKKGLLAGYFQGLEGLAYGESFGTIFRYVIPEMISALLLYSLPILIDSYFISQLESTATYATLGATNNITYFILKVAESISIGGAIVVGQLNGMHAYEQVGKALKDAFWLTCIVGFTFAFMIYAAAHSLLVWYGMPHEMIELGVPFLKMRAITVFFTFVYLGLVGFLRGVKNTYAPMVIALSGTVLFICCDYVLIFGRFGLPRMELQGSAIASVVQYTFMFGALLAYILTHETHRKYQIRLWKELFSAQHLWQLATLSAPVMLDKATMAWSYIWLCKMINPMGACAVASYCIVKDITRFAFVPAMAGAQVITFLVSNDTAVQEWDAIYANIKKVCLVVGILVSSILLAIFSNLHMVVRWFDAKGEFAGLAVQTLPIISVLVLCDLVQLVLSGALRGAGNVKVVMYTRVTVCLGYFIPLSYVLAHVPIEESLKFILVYGSFYVGNVLLGMVYINRLRGDEWKMLSLKGSE